MGKSFCPRKVAARFKSFGLKPKQSGWGFKVLDVEMSVPSVSGYLATLMVERRDWPNSYNSNSMPGVGEGVLPGAVQLEFWWICPSGGMQICPSILEKINSVFIK